MMRPWQFTALLFAILAISDDGPSTFPLLALLALGIDTFDQWQDRRDKEKRDRSSVSGR